MEKQIRNVFYKNEFYLRQIDDGISQTRDILQNIVDQWEKVSPDRLSMDLLLSLIDKSRRPVAEKVLQAVQMSRAKKSSLYGEIDDGSLLKIQKPVDIGDLLEAMDHLHGYIPFAEFRDVFNSQCFVIEGQRVRIVSEEVDRLKLRYCETVDTDTEEKRKKSVEAVISAMNVLITEHPDVKAVKLVIPGLVTVDQNNGLQPSPSFVKSGKI